MPDISIPSLFNVKGKIGTRRRRMIAEGFVRNGATVYIAARKEQQLKDAVHDMKQLAPAGGGVHYVVADVSSKAGCDTLISEFKKREATLHVLVNNSGLGWSGPFDDFPEAKGWDYVFNVNVKSVFYMTAGLSDYLSQGSTALDPGRVLNISSIASVQPANVDVMSKPEHGVWSYGPSKSAVNHLTSQLAVKLAPKFVTVNAILPGFFPNKATAGLTKFLAEVAESQPMGRVGATPDIAGLALFLASPAGAHVTGQRIIIDGGLSLFDFQRSKM
ncbi:hypothetical protein FB45DRAFT_975491 [Roridomyces roridus]|uniref:NAD(P)-binding protein n=1 Tax=Roridomyces roridus TaxID=1738132 RepID=A0AAD7CC66_9AGAR|nr:hypothetical protein FB45DRAFT_975491 [Roridomyces roridus]